MKVLAPLAESGHINYNASIRDSQSTIINAPIEKIWKGLTEFEKWPEWNQDIHSVKVTEIKPGASFSFTIHGDKLNATLRKVEAPETLAWTTSSLGIKSIYVWRLESTDGNQTIVSAEASLQGPFTLFYSHQKLHGNLLNWLSRLSQYSTK